MKSGARPGSPLSSTDEGYKHACRRKGCGHVDAATDQEQRRCPRDGRKLWVKPVVRPIRFQDLSHTTASLLIMSGANLPAVQRILRHSDSKITTEIYAHLAPEYLRAEVDRLSFGAAVLATVPDGGRPLTPTLSPAPQGRGGDAFVTRLLPEAGTGKKQAGTRGSKPRGFRPSGLERETKLEPATLSLGTHFTDSPIDVRPSQAVGNAGEREGTRIQPSQSKKVVLGLRIPAIVNAEIGAS